MCFLIVRAIGRSHDVLCVASVLVCLGWVGGGNGGLQSSIVCDDRMSHSYSLSMLHGLAVALLCGFSFLGFRLMLGPPSVPLPGLQQGGRLVKHVLLCQASSQKSPFVTASY